MAAFSNMHTRQDIFDAVTRIKQVTQEPSDFLMDLLVQQQQFACIEWLWRFKVMEEVPLPPTTILYEDVASKIHVPGSILRAVARMAMTVGVLCETEDGRLAHNPLSAALVTDDDLATWLSHILNRSVPCMRAFPQAAVNWPNPAKGNETAYNVAMNTDLPFFDHLKANPDIGAEFGKYMQSQAKVNTGASVDHLVTGFDWAALGNAKIVDVGGNSGSASLALAQAFPHLRFIVQDLPDPIQQARSQAESSFSKETAARIEFMEHDFFTEQPVKDADIYLLRMIIHDWPDADAVRILKLLTTAMIKPGSRIVIMDMMLPPPGSRSRTLEAILRQKDLMMRQVLNAKEREAEDWHALIRAVEDGLHINAIRCPEGSHHSIFEIRRR
ncbi:O-methyltransferase fsr2 [Lachnellula arida]|uniref:O-methyltransferase fsr2 n=1 Tax=Lachnellula arida TaxID=1316785 RepID=A0A8T9BMS5_9HELO|nr:O-methyltransferase fsr2 [Lachnellula arida]